MDSVSSIMDEDLPGWNEPATDIGLKADSSPAPEDKNPDGLLEAAPAVQVDQLAPREKKAL